MNIKMKVERLKVKGLTLLAVILFSATTFAQDTFETANTAYAEGRYAEAASGYEALLEKEPSATLYYNAGNAYFKQDHLAKAILNYERALRMDPNHKDAKFNLEFAQSKTKDNIQEEDFFLTVWARTVRDSLSENTWVMGSIGLFILCLVGILLFLLSREIWVRKTAFHTAWVALLFCIIAGVNAGSRHNENYQKNTLRNEAIIMQGVVNVKSEPNISSGKILIELHEGTKVTILEESSNGWVNVRVGRNEGWIPLTSLERI